VTAQAGGHRRSQAATKIAGQEGGCRLPVSRDNGQLQALVVAIPAQQLKLRWIVTGRGSSGRFRPRGRRGHKGPLAIT